VKRFCSETSLATFPTLRVPSPIHMKLSLAKISTDSEIEFTRRGLHADYARWRTNNPRGRLVGSSLVNKTFMIMSASCGACGKFSNSREENSLHVFPSFTRPLVPKISISQNSLSLFRFHRLCKFPPTSSRSFSFPPL